MGFLCVGIGAGAAALVAAGLATGHLAVLAGLTAAQWTAGIYLGGGAFAFILCVMTLQCASPTLVANTMTVNPIAAALLATTGGIEQSV